MISLAIYFGDRESRYRLECTDAIHENAILTVACINAVLALAEKEGIIREIVSSGWRPQSVNDATKNAAKNSKHLVANAGDIADSDRKLAQWCVSNPNKLAECGVWIEDPRWTPTWVHFQRVPPDSGKRIYVPNRKPPSAPALIGQKPVPTQVKT